MNYSKLRKEQLIELCQSRGLDTGGLLKQGLIDMLKESDRYITDQENGNGNDEAERNGSDGESDQDRNEEAGKEGNDPSLKMKLAMAKAETDRARAETDRMKMELELLRARAELNGDAPERIMNTEGGRASGKMQLPFQADGEDPTAFLQSFEKVARLQGVKEDKWAQMIPSLLNSKLRAHYNRLDYDVCSDYKLLKFELLKSVRLNAKFYLDKFKIMHRSGSETYTQFLNRLSDVQRYYLEAKKIDEFQQLRSDMLLERFKESLPVDARFFVDSRQPVTPSQAAEFADLHFDCRLPERQSGTKFGQRGEGVGVHKPTHAPNPTDESPRPDGVPPSKAERGKFLGNGGKPSSAGFVRRNNFVNFVKNDDGRGSKTSRIGACFRCGSLSHKIGQCNLFETGSAQTHLVKPKETVISGLNYQKQFVIPTYVNGVLLEALRDSGSPVTLVRAGALLPDELICTGNTIALRGVFGSARSFPTARVKIHSPKFGLGAPEVEIVVAVVQDLEPDILLGNDIFELNAQLRDPINCTQATPGCGNPMRRDVSSDTERTGDREGSLNIASGMENNTSANVVRLCTRKKQYDQKGKEKRSEGMRKGQRDGPNVKTKLKPDDQTDAMTDWLKDFQLTDTDRDVDTRFDVNNDFSGDQDNDIDDSTLAIDSGTKIPDLRNERDSEGTDGERPTSEVATEGETGNLLGANEFKTAQTNDPTLRDLFIKADRGHPGFAKFKGLLYRREINPLIDTENDNVHNAKLVVPKAYRLQVLDTCHSSVWSGHLGVRKTKDRLRKQFWWPSCEKETSQYVRECHECQIHAKRRVADRVPLCATPIIKEPFSEIFIDFCGPINPTSSSGKKYILTVIDAATNWVELFALPSMRAEGVCKALIEVFSRMGVARTIRCDQGTHFKNQLVIGLQQMLGSSIKFSVPHHSESAGKVERFIGTMRSVLRKCIAQDGRNWDQVLPMLAFAYREVPCADSGWSAFDLLLSHEVRGPSKILRESWTQENEGEPRSVAQYLIKTRERLQRCAMLAETAKAAAQTRMKTWYDQRSRDRKLSVSDLVLVLMPTTANKLLSAWLGPFIITRQLSKFNYEVMIGRRTTILHINLLKKYHTREHRPQEGAADGGTRRTEGDSVAAKGATRGSRENPEDGAVLVQAVAVADACADEFERLPSIDVDESFGDADWHIGEELTPEQNGQLRALLGEFKEQFGTRPGRTHLIEHRIRLTNEKPANPKIYRIPDRLKDQVEDEIKIMLRDGMIEPSDSCFVNPIVCVKRKGVDEKGRPNIRICVDLRAVNQSTIGDEYRSSNVKEILEKCAGAKYKSCLDLAQGFMTIELEEQSRQYTSFRGPSNFFRFTRMPFGAKNASKTFQRLMDHVLRGAEKYATSHVDDITIFSKTWDEHLMHIRDVLARLKAAGLIANPTKCVFARKSMKCLGHVLENGMIKPDPDKVKCITEFPTPRTKKNVKSFLGIVNYYRSHIDGAAAIAKPLTDLTRRSEPDKVVWTQIHEDAFRELKACLSREPVLIAPDPTKGYTLKSDACHNALAAGIYQTGDDGIDHPVAFASRKLLPRETH